MHIFVDTSIAVASLGIGPEDLINDLRVYTDSIGGSVYHYRDANGLECDAVIHLKNGDYAFKRKDGIFVVPIGCLKN